MTNRVTIVNHGPYMISVAGGSAGGDIAPGEFREVTMWAGGGDLSVTEPAGFPRTHEQLKKLREERDKVVPAAM